MSDYCCTQHFYEVAAGERFFDLVVKKHADADGTFPPQKAAPWPTLRDGDIGYAVGVLMTALRHQADHVEWMAYLAKAERRRTCGVEGCFKEATHKSGMLVACEGHAKERQRVNMCEAIPLETVPALTNGSLG